MPLIWWNTLHMLWNHQFYSSGRGGASIDLSLMFSTILLRESAIRPVRYMSLALFHFNVYPVWMKSIINDYINDYNSWHDMPELSARSALQAWQWCQALAQVLLDPPCSQYFWWCLFSVSYCGGKGREVGSGVVMLGYKINWCCQPVCSWLMAQCDL